MYAQYLAGRGSSNVPFDATLPHKGHMAMKTCLFDSFSTNLTTGRTQAAVKMNRGRSAAEAAVATFGDKWSRLCQTQFAPLWRSISWFLRPLAPQKLMKSSMSMNRKSRLSRPIRANTNKTLGQTQARLGFGSGYSAPRVLGGVQ